MALMTRAQMNRDAIWERLEEMTEQSLHRARSAAKGPLVVRMDEVQERGEYDRDANGFNAMYRGPVGGEPMQAQAVALEGDLVICFWSATRDHHRRFLVTAGQGGRPVYWMEMEARAVPCGPQSKYHDAIKRVVCLHLHSRDTVSLTGLGMDAARQGSEVGKAA